MVVFVGLAFVPSGAAVAPWRGFSVIPRKDMTRPNPIIAANAGCALSSAFAGPVICGVAEFGCVRSTHPFMGMGPASGCDRLCPFASVKFLLRQGHWGRGPVRGGAARESKTPREGRSLLGTRDSPSSSIG